MPPVESKKPDGACPVCLRMNAMRVNINLKVYQCRYCDHRVSFESEPKKMEALPDPGWIVDDICAETTSQIKCEEVAKYYFNKRETEPLDMNVKRATFVQYRLAQLGTDLKNRICQDAQLSALLKNFKR